MHVPNALLKHNCLAITRQHAGHSDNDTDFITALTGLFKDIATAVEENHDMLFSFGASFPVDFILGLQAECDIQVQQGTSSTGQPPSASCQNLYFWQTLSASLANPDKALATCR